MIENFHGYTAVRKVAQGFRPVGKHAFKIIHNARAVKYNLIQQFEDSTGIILPSGVKSNLCTQSVPFLGKQLAVMEMQIKEKKHEAKRFTKNRPKYYKNARGPQGD